MRVLRDNFVSDEWKNGWTLVLACFVGFSYLSVMTGSLSMFMEPLANEFGWSKTLISTGFTLAALMTALLSPVFGMLVDRFGSRLLAIPGLILTSLIISSFYYLNGSATQWIMLWLMYAVISIAIKTTIWTAAVAGVFHSGKGLALGVTLCGSAAAQAILPPLTNWLIDAFGWRLAYVWLGLGWGSIALLICYFFLFDAHNRQRGERSLGKTRKAELTNQSSRPDFPGLTMAEASRNRALWLIAASTFFIMILTVGLTVHQISILSEAGVSRTHAAFLAAMAGIAGVAGKLVTGVLLDNYRPNWVGGVTLAVTALAFALLIEGIASPILVFIAMLINGYTQGTKLQINGYLTAKYAGMKNFGGIYGFMNSLVAFGGGVGPVVAAVAFDISGSYTGFLVIGVVGSLVCGILLISLPPYPDWDEAPVGKIDSVVQTNS